MAVCLKPRRVHSAVTLSPSPLPPLPPCLKTLMLFCGTAALSLLLPQRAQHVSGRFLNMFFSSRAQKSLVACLVDANACWQEYNATGTCWWEGRAEEMEIHLGVHTWLFPALSVWCNSVFPPAVMGHRAVWVAQGRVCIWLPSALAS